MAIPDNPRLRISRHGLERLDLLLVAVEALDLNGGEAMLWTMQQKGYLAVIPNRVEFWKKRSCNPLRRYPRRETLRPEEIIVMVNLVCHLSERLYPILRQLISSTVPEALSAARMERFVTRLRRLVRERMNPKRAAVQQFEDPHHCQAMARTLVRILAFSAGPGGPRRLIAHLQDGLQP
ncbi:MAG: DUF3038 domain-containing protein [Aphanocapsa feldmannii 277cV]|uniref:DUF3038 domain-containing protein n=1 Tax=Aphanocapsa feldmannii 277cV TaxID=2507553 RepID=A0A524RMM7_9CHRO|nr:MAG: DUF3038 domain-containing protein [Aphanocapsa feldmannii 288cV]TGG91868.1 MAG: DUF3038 domain-containing protein [Aphanocapsa feldmannii 277cV]